MEEERKAYFSYTLDSYDSDTRLFKLNIYLTIRYGDEDNGIFMEVKATEDVTIAHNIVPGLYDEDIYVEPRVLRERAERLLRLLQELKAREVF